MNPVNPQSWRTDDLARLEAGVEEAAYALTGEMERSQSLVDKLDRETTPPTDAEVEQFRNAVVNGPNVTPEWRLVAERIERGEFAWRDIVEGDVLADPEVNAAFASIRGLAVGDGSDGSEDGGEQAASFSRDDQQLSDDDYFGRSIFEEGR